LRILETLTQRFVWETEGGLGFWDLAVDKDLDLVAHY
jgi:hypothetical protein